MEESRSYEDTKVPRGGEDTRVSSDVHQTQNQEGDDVLQVVSMTSGYE